MERTQYGTLKDGRAVDGFWLRNKKGLEVHCINYGCRLTHVLVPNADGSKTDILLGFDDLRGFEEDGTFQGTVVGRYANRIANAGFELGGQRYELLKSQGPNYLHGTFHQKVFDAEVIGENSVTFTYTAADGEDGFPGEVWVAITYTLTDENELMLGYRAVPTADTHINLTNHAYFNLAGEGDVLEQTLMLNSSTFLEGGEWLLPTGRVMETANGVFDFSSEKAIGRDIFKDDPQLKLGGGYDQCFIIDKEAPELPALAAVAKHPQSGRSLRVVTTQPAIQFFTGSNMDGTVPGKGGKPLLKYGGFCLETQHYPDSPNHPDFPTTLVRAGEKYRQSTVLKFGW